MYIPFRDLNEADKYKFGTFWKFERLSVKNCIWYFFHNTFFLFKKYSLSYGILKLIGKLITKWDKYTKECERYQKRTKCLKKSTNQFTSISKNIENDVNMENKWTVVSTFFEIRPLLRLRG